VAAWLHTEIDVRHRELNLDMVAHLITNQARHRLTLIKTNALTTCQTTSSKLHNCNLIMCSLVNVLSHLIWTCRFRWNFLANSC